MKRYRIFLSSPTDVQAERDRAEFIIRKVNAERVDHTQFELFRWEDEYYRAEGDFQSQIPKASTCDIVVFLFWKRLGTELPPEYARPDGTIPTGTEYEFEDAMTAAIGAPEKLPDILAYRKTAEVMFSAGMFELEKAQYDRFLSFWQRWFRNEKGHFVAGFQAFHDADEFEQLFERNLRAWLADREANVTWTKGSPYRGLEPFDVEHAPIYFGRRREVERARARLIAAAMSGTAFLLISGASGSGKSSLARGGLIARIAQAGGLSTVADTVRRAILTPGQIGGDWPLGLATALFSEDAIGKELARGDTNDPARLRERLARVDASSILPVMTALNRVGESIAEAEHRKSPVKVSLVLLLDQFEEIFAWPRGRASVFLRLVHQLATLPDSPVIVVATMRSDFQHRLAEFPELLALSGRAALIGPEEGERTLELELPSQADFREMIVSPARAAGLEFESKEDGSDLAQIIEQEARPEAMPAVEFLLDQLYARRRGNLLTFEAFEALRGVGGVMGSRGEDVYRSVSPPARNAFSRVVRALVTQVRSDAPASARRVREDSFEADAPAAELVAELKQARLIISNHGEIKFAHESILRGWERLKQQVSEEQRLFEVRERLEQVCRRWVEAKKGDKRKRDSILLEGFQLAEGRELLQKWGSRSLADQQPELPAYIMASHARDKRARRRMLAVGWSVAAIFAGLSVLLYNQWISTDAARSAEKEARLDAQAALWSVNARAALNDGEIRRALDEATRAFEARPSETSRSGLGTAIFEISPHLVRTYETGTNNIETLFWVDDSALAYGTASGDVKILRSAATEPRSASGWTLPNVTRRLDGNRASVRAVQPLEDGRLLIVTDEGSLALSSPGPSTPIVRPSGQAKTLFHVPAAAAIGRTGSAIVMASVDADVVLVDCRPSQSTNWVSDCRERQIDGIRGTVAAVSPDESRFVVGTETGDVLIYEREGLLPAARIAIGGKLQSVAWSTHRDWIAIGDDVGRLTVIDVGASQPTFIASSSIPDNPITAIAWNPASGGVAFTCGKFALCIWPFSRERVSEIPPILMLEGHRNDVVRIGWSLAGSHLASAATDGTVRVWAARPEGSSAGSVFYPDTVTNLHPVATSPDGRWLGAGSADGTIRIWEATSGELVRVAKTSTPSEIVALSWSRSGLLAAQHDVGTISLVAADTAQEVREIAFETQRGTSLVFAMFDRMLVTPQHGDHAVALLDVTKSGRQAPELLPPGSDDVWGVSVDPSGRKLFSTETGGNLRIWDLEAKAALGVMAYKLSDPPIDRVGGNSLSVSANGLWLATSGGDSFVRVYDVTRREVRWALPIDAGEPNAVAFSPDGSKLAALGSDNRLYVWDWLSKEPERLLSLSALPARAAVAGFDRAHEEARGMAWISSSRLAISSGISAINVIDVDPSGWLRRRKAVAPRIMSSIE